MKRQRYLIWLIKKVAQLVELWASFLKVTSSNLTICNIFFSYPLHNNPAQCGECDLHEK